MCRLLLHARHNVKDLSGLPYIIVAAICGCKYQSHIIEEEFEAQRGYITFFF